MNIGLNLWLRGKFERGIKCGEMTPSLQAQASFLSNKSHTGHRTASLNRFLLSSREHLFLVCSRLVKFCKVLQTISHYEKTDTARLVIKHPNHCCVRLAEFSPGKLHRFQVPR